MAITRRGDIGTEFYGLRQLNRLLDDAFSGWPLQEQGTIMSSWLPPCDVVEDSNGVRIVMEIPGVEPDDVRLSLENNLLTIRGEKRQQQEGKDGKVHRYERSYGTFERTFSLPNTVETDKVEADFENGILTVTMPKSERVRPREIPLNRSESRKRQVEAGNGEARR
ncbi:MAG TPA: Hsp20/alpha crystallin family protein [Gemmatimonadales bacterium]|nr:Hsp20/alpha crystallin family protein [Gemmatimonadales bacterium]